MKNGGLNLQKKIRFYLIIFLLIPAIFLSSICFIPKTPLYAQSLEDELEQVKKDKEETQKKIEEVKKQESAYLKDVKAVETQLLESLSQLDDLNDRLSEAKADIDKTTIDLVLKEQELKEIEEELTAKAAILNDRVASIYKYGDGNFLAIILKSEDFVEFVSRFKLMTLLASEDSKVIEEIKDKREANLNVKKIILELRDKQQQKKEQVENLVSQAEAKQAEIEGIYDEKSDLLSKTRSDKNALLALEKQYENKEAEINRILESYRYGNAPGGKFLWPVSSYISSGFGWRIHPILGYKRFHSGIDLPAPTGTPVKSADSGQVISAGYDGGYGYSILVYHGGGVATVYAHLSRILVSVGQNVERGQIIGSVGSTGLATGPHLHFEVRINGVAQNPVQYLQ